MQKSNPNILTTKLKQQSTSKNQKQRQNLFSNQNKNDRLKQIDKLYESQMNQIYLESKQASQRQIQKEKNKISQEKDKIYFKSKVQQKIKLENKSPYIINKNHHYRTTSQFTPASIDKTQVKNSLHNNQMTPQVKKDFLNTDSIKKSSVYQDKIRASSFLQGQSSRTIEILRRQNQTKQMKIRQLTNTCQNLIDKLKNHLSPQQAQAVLSTLKQFSQKKMQRLESLFKIKNQQIFFKIKLQIISLLQEFQLAKQQIQGINEITTQSALFSFMVKKIKVKFKNLKSKEQQSNFQIQKDKILNQKYQERVHYLMQTNQLLKLSESKLKQKTEDLRNQLNVFLQKLKNKQKQVQDRQSQIFRLKKEKQELTSSNSRILSFQKNLSSQMTDQRRIYEAKQKQMKALLSNYFLQKKKLQSELQQKQTYIQQLHIKVKFFEQENEKVNRQYIRWKQRYQWLQKQKDNRQKQYDQQKIQLLNQFQDYKQQNNQGLFLACKAQTDDALRKLQEYQQSYQKVIIQLDEQRRRSQFKEQQINKKIQDMQLHWIQKMKAIELVKQQQVYEVNQEMQNRQDQIRQQFNKKQKLLVQQMQARMKTFIAQNDKKRIENIINLEFQNDQLRKEIDNLKRVVQLKESTSLSSLNQNNHNVSQPSNTTNLIYHSNGVYRTSENSSNYNNNTQSSTIHYYDYNKRR